MQVSGVPTLDVLRLYLLGVFGLGGVGGEGRS